VATSVRKKQAKEKTTTPELIQRAQEFISEDPGTSIRKLATVLRERAIPTSVGLLKRIWEPVKSAWYSTNIKINYNSSSTFHISTVHYKNKKKFHNFYTKKSKMKKYRNFANLARHISPLKYKKTLNIITFGNNFRQYY